MAFLDNPINPTVSDEKEMLVSECCDFSVYPITSDDFNKIHIKNSQTDEDLVMTVAFICNRCGKTCTVKRIRKCQQKK